MSAATILIAGSGYVGSRLTAHLRAQGHRVIPIRRTAMPNDAEAVTGDLTEPETIILPQPITHVVFCAGLQRAEPAAYTQLFIDGFSRFLQHLAGQPLQQFLFTSTTGVYAEVHGGSVDEDSPTAPRRAPAAAYLAAEQHLQAAPFPTVVARLSGIYGPNRTRLIERVRTGQECRQRGPVQYVNQVHVDDIVGALAHLLFLPRPAPCYNLTDCAPTDRNQVLEWLAHELNVEPPAWSDAGVPAAARRGGNKQCRNQRLLDSGYTFTYPTYQEGYSALLRASPEGA